MPSAVDTIILTASSPIIVSKVKAIRILHVDDDSSFLEISKLLLEDKNSVFEIETAPSVD